MHLVSTPQLTDVNLVKSYSIVNQPTIRDQKIIKSLGKKYSLIVLGWNRGIGLLEGFRDTISTSLPFFVLGVGFLLNWRGIGQSYTCLRS